MSCNVRCSYYLGQRSLIITESCILQVFSGQITVNVTKLLVKSAWLSNRNREYIFTILCQISNFKLKLSHY